MKYIKKLWVLLLFISTPAFGSGFIEGMDDIPLMDGMRQIHSSNISFGNDESRFDEAYISSEKVSFAKAAVFYKNTLPQLGWNIVGTEENALHFERDMEILDIALEKSKPVLVRITLKSKD